MNRIILIGLVTVFAGAAYSDPVFTPIPMNATTSVPGGITGWGYDISNPDPMNYLVLNDSYVTGSLSTGTYGNYVDYLVSNFIVVGPGGDTGPVAFSPGAAGVGEFDFNRFVPIPTIIPGEINIDYSLFSQDPNNPTFDPGSFVTSGTITASAEVTLTPEPASVLLLGLVLLPIAIAVRRYCR